jgi:protein O-GlcNAc transferase
MGAALEKLGRLTEAIDSYRTAVKLNPKLLAIRVWLHHERRLICDWDGIETEANELRALMAAAGSEPVHPFAVLAMGLSTPGQWHVARSFAASFAAPRSSTGGKNSRAQENSE